MTKPNTKINSAQQPDKLNARGLDSEIVTKHQLKKALHLVFHVKEKQLKMLSVKEAQGVLNVRIAIPDYVDTETTERLKAALSDLTDAFEKGMVTGKRSTEGSFDYIRVGVNTLECKVQPEKKYDLYKALATFVNEEAKRQPKPKKMLEKLSNIPAAPEMQHLG